LAPQQLCKACSGNETRKYKGEAKWRDPPGNADAYRPRYNFAPNVYCPVLVSGHHFTSPDDTQSDTGSGENSEHSEEEKFEPEDLVIQPMRWGLLPSYYKDDKKFSYSTINARSEGITEKPTFRVPLSKGRRCVVLADGFYEWKRGPKAKQPYLIYFPQDKPIKWDHPEEENGGQEWTGRRLLTMAGIFEINRTGDHPLYTYSIITVPASKNLEWMHDRMPALLDGDEAVDKWLDSENVPLEQALKLLKPVDEVSYHAVTVSMGNVRNQGPECILPLEAKQVNPIAPPKQTNTLLQYFKRQGQSGVGEKSEQDESSEESEGASAPKTPKKF